MHGGLPLQILVHASQKMTTRMLNNDETAHKHREMGSKKEK